VLPEIHKAAPFFIYRYNLFMFSIAPLEPINYLIIGHITRDLLPSGPRIGGTAAYAGLTAQAMGLRVGIITSWGSELPLGNQIKKPLESSAAYSYFITLSHCSILCAKCRLINLKISYIIPAKSLKNF
jgi:hypothetical protein